jgi:outer membrane protein assembly factor BamB
MCVLCLLGAAAPTDAAEPAGSGWPGWRGPTGDGISDQVPATMPDVKLLWKKSMAGVCSAGVSAADGYVVVGDHAKKTDHYRCYRADGGEKAWVFSTPNVAKLDYGAGPRATPCIHAARVYCIGAAGDLHCLDLKTGKPVWQKSFVKDFAAGELPTWGHCTAPIIVDGKLLVHPRSLLALDPATGKTIWQGASAGPNYSTFLVGSFGGIRQAIGYDAENIAGWDVKTGKRLWNMEVDNSNGYIVPGPVAVGGKLLLATENEDARIYGFGKQGRLVCEPQAESEELAPEMATPTIVNGLVLGVSEGLVCLDPADKLKRLWVNEDKLFHGLCHIVASKDRALVFSADGKMVLVAPERTGCRILGSKKLSLHTWSHPALMGGHVYLRDEKMFYCYRLSAKGAAKPAG